MRVKCHTVKTASLAGGDVEGVKPRWITVMAVNESKRFSFRNLYRQLPLILYQMELEQIGQMGNSIKSNPE